MQILMKTYGLAAALISLCVFALLGSTAIAQEIPHYAKEKHLGVASCASGVCHGSVRTRTATDIAQNEYVIWSRRDRHRVAYNTLLTKASKKIAKNMGLKNAHEAKICLDCHTDNVSENKRGPKFQLTDGIGCEACHGGGENYISNHVDADTPRSEVISAGLYPIDDARARAKVCLSCHMGNSQKLASHDIMGAGHPRLSFELDAFTALQPAHFVMDEDYRSQKWSGASVDLWAIGQIEAAKQTLHLLDTRLKNGGLFPELALFDCHACHHGMADQKWQASSMSNLPAGSVRLNDANFIILSSLASVVKPALATSLKQKLKALHKSVNKGRANAAIAELKSVVNQIDKAVTAANLKSLHSKLLASITKDAKNGKMRDYVSAEQALMAIDMLLGASGKRGKHGAWLNKAFDSLGDEDEFQPSRFINVMKQAKL